MLDDSDVRRVRPFDLLAYLVPHGWKCRHMNGINAIWTIDKDLEEFEIIQPLRTDFGDYCDCVRHALITIAVAERTSVPELLAEIESRCSSSGEMERGKASLGPRDISKLSRNLVREQEISITTEDWAVDWAEPKESASLKRHKKRTETLVELIAKIMESAQEDVHGNVELFSPRGLWTQEYIWDLRHHRFSSLIGKGYIFTVHHGIEEVEKLLSRRGYMGTMTIHKPYRAYKESALHIPSVFDARGGPWFMPGGSGRQRSERRPHWLESVRPLVPHAQLIVQRDVMSLQEREDVCFHGFVVELNRMIGSDVGSIAVLAVIEGVLRHIELQVAADEYEIAIEAHKNRLPVTVRDSALRESASLELTSRTESFTEDDPLDSMMRYVQENLWMPK